VKSPIEYAVTEGDAEILGMLIGAVPRVNCTNFEVCRSSLAEALESVPDFTMEISFNCESPIIPFVKSFAPSDVYKIYKTKDKLRIDLTLLGLMGRKGLRGNMSIVFKGRQGSLLLLNHNTKTTETVFADLTDKSIEMIVEELLSEQKNAQSGQQISLHRVIYKGKPISKMIEGYPCNKYEINYKRIYDKNKNNLFKQYDDFEDYFNDSSLHPTLDSNSSVNENGNKATVWISNKYLLKFVEFSPVIYILSYVSEYFAKLSALLTECHIENEGFPLKFAIPLYYTLSINIALCNLQFTSMDDDFMNIDEQYKSTGEQVHDCKIKLYSPITRGMFRSCQSFVQPADLFVEDNDRLRWTSYESEGKDSILLTKENFESLLQDNSINESHLPVQIVKTGGDDSREMGMVEDETEQTNAHTVNENVKSHSIFQIRTLNMIVIDKLENELCEARRRREENIKKIMNHKKAKHSWDSTKTTRVPFAKTKFKIPIDKLLEESKIARTQPSKELLWHSGSIDNLRVKLGNKNSARNKDLLRLNEKKLKLFKKTADIDVVLNPI
jgi:hypothetical protein